MYISVVFYIMKFWEWIYPSSIKVVAEDHCIDRVISPCHPTHNIIKCFYQIKLRGEISLPKNLKKTLLLPMQILTVMEKPIWGRGVVRLCKHNLCTQKYTGIHTPVSIYNSHPSLEETLLYIYYWTLVTKTIYPLRAVSACIAIQHNPCNMYSHHF